MGPGTPRIGNWFPCRRCTGAPVRPRLPQAGAPNLGVSCESRPSPRFPCEVRPTKPLDVASILRVMSSGSEPGRPSVAVLLSHTDRPSGSARGAATQSGEIWTIGRIGKGCSRIGASPVATAPVSSCSPVGTGLLLQQGSAQRPAALPVLSGRCRACPHRRRAKGVPRRDLRPLRRPGRAVRSAQRPTRLLQHLLRQGQGRNNHPDRPTLHPRGRSRGKGAIDGNHHDGRPDRAGLVDSGTRLRAAPPLPAEQRKPTAWASSSSARWSARAPDPGTTRLARRWPRPRRRSGTSRRSRSSSRRPWCATGILLEYQI